MADLGKVSRALISVTDKTGVVEFAKALAEEFGVEIISTGGTAKVLVEAGVPASSIWDQGLSTVRDNDRFFSYRAEGGTCGRHAAVAVIA